MMYCVCAFIVFFFFKQKTAYEMRISDWSSDVCSSDLRRYRPGEWRQGRGRQHRQWRHRRRQRRPRPRHRGRQWRRPPGDRKSVVSGKSVSVRVDLGGRRIIKKKKKTQSITLADNSDSHTDAHKIETTKIIKPLS